MAVGRGDLSIKKTLSGECELINEIDPGDKIEFCITIENSSPEPREISVYDALDPYTMEALEWVGVDIGAGITTGSDGAGADLIDETLTLAPCTIFKYTITVTTLSPFCGVVSNCARWCTPAMKRPEYIDSPPVYVGILESEACLGHERLNMNDALWQLMPTDPGRASKLQVFLEAGYDLVDIIEAISKLLVGEESTAKPFNPDWEGFAVVEERREAIAARLADAQERAKAAAKKAATPAEKAVE